MKLSEKAKFLISLGVIACSVLFMLQGIVFFGKVPSSSDASNWKGNAQPIKDWNEKNPEDPAMWMNNLFGGMPAYLTTDRIPYEKIIAEGLFSVGVTLVIVSFIFFRAYFKLIVLLVLLAFSMYDSLSNFAGELHGIFTLFFFILLIVWHKNFKFDPPLF